MTPRFAERAPLNWKERWSDGRRHNHRRSYRWRQRKRASQRRQPERQPLLAVYHGRIDASGGSAFATNSNRYHGYCCTGTCANIRRTSGGLSRVWKLPFVTPEAKSN